MARWNPHPKRSDRLRHHQTLNRGLGLFLALLACPAHAEDAAPLAPLGMDPAIPQYQPLPGGMVPSFGVPPDKTTDWRFDFHGMFTAPLRAGINTRDNPRPDQSSTVFHAPPIVPDDLETFSHTGVVQNPFAQLNLSYGNSIVTGTVTLLARQENTSTAYFDPSAQMGINDAFVSINVPGLPKNLSLRVNAGAFSNRYGQTGEYDLGRYGTPLVAAINGVGETINAGFAFGDFAFNLEQGFQGNSNRPGGGITPDAWNGWTDQRVGGGLVNHLHAGISFRRLVTVGGHYIAAIVQDERATSNHPDGKLRVIAGDVRLNMARFGHLYAAYSHVKAEDATSVGRLVEVLNTKGGAGLDDNYFCTLSIGCGTGNGSLNIIGGQYDLSVGRLVSYPVAFLPDGPDLFVSLFGMYTSVSSPFAYNDGVKKMKLGVEATYSVLPWLAVSGRYDRVDPDIDDKRYSFAVMSPRLIFRTNWDSHDQVVLQYSRWFNGSRTTVRTGTPPHEDITVVPDENMISLSASMWW